MTKFIIPAATVCTMSILIAFSCKKNADNSAGPTQSVNQLFSGMRYTPQNLSVTAGRDTIVYGNKGTLLHFYPNSFRVANGDIITSGIVNFQLVEMYKIGDMICNRATAVTAKEPLQSGGEINLIATMNGKTVYANRFGVGFIQAAASPDTMQLFYGDANNADSVTAWTVGNNSKGSIANGTDTANVHAYYLFDSCTSFNSLNCDHFCSQYHVTESELTEVNAIVTDKSFIGNTTVYLAFPAINSAMPLMNANSDTFRVWVEGNKIPVGWNYKLAAMSNKLGHYYYFETSGVTSHGMVIKMQMASETKGDIIARLQGL